MSAHGYAQIFKVGMTSKTLFYLPFYVAQKKGFYNAENLKVELILIGRSDVHLQALLTGEIDFGTFNADGVIAVNEKGANLKVIAGVDNAAPYFLVGAKNSKRSTISKARGLASPVCAAARRRSCSNISRPKGFSFRGILS